MIDRLCALLAWLAAAMIGAAVWCAPCLPPAAWLAGEMVFGAAVFLNVVPRFTHGPGGWDFTPGSGRRLALRSGVLAAAAFVGLLAHDAATDPGFAADFRGSAMWAAVGVVFALGCVVFQVYAAAMKAYFRKIGRWNEPDPPASA